jgi:hypothetical protein
MAKNLVLQGRAEAGVENRLFTIRLCDALMVQPWCVSRFYGQLSMIEARIERAGSIQIIFPGCASSWAL